MRLPTILLILQLAAVARPAFEDPGSAGTAVTTSPADSPDHAPVSSLVDLQPGDELVVRYLSYSCFHTALWGLSFRRGDALSVSVDLLRSSPAGVRQPQHLAVLAVSDSAAADLDRILRIHREAPERRSNGGVTIDLTQVRSGSVVGQEHLANNPVIRRLGSYGFNALFDQARRAAPASTFWGLR